MKTRRQHFRLHHALLILGLLSTGGFIVLASTVLTRVTTSSFEEELQRHLDRSLGTAWLTMDRSLTHMKTPLALFARSPELITPVRQGDLERVEAVLGNVYRRRLDILFDLLLVHIPSRGMWANQSSDVATTSESLSALKAALSSSPAKSSFVLSGVNQGRYLMFSVPIPESEAMLYGGMLLTGSDPIISDIRINSRALCAYFLQGTDVISYAGSDPNCQEHASFAGSLTRWNYGREANVMLIRGPTTDSFELPELEIALLYLQETIPHVQEQLFRELGLISLGFLIINIVFFLVGKALIGRSVDGLVRYANADHQNQVIEPPDTRLHEFASIAQAFADMVRRVREGFLARQDVEQQLRDLNMELEARVHTRTQELSSVNSLLEEAKNDAILANQAKSDFLATMSHEIRTPLTAIIGWCEYLRDSNSDQAQVSVINKLNHSADDLVRIIDDILDISTIEAKKIQIVESPFDVRELVQRVGEALAYQATSKGLDLTISVDPGVPVTLITDQGRVHQILLNLLSNAIKYTDTGGVYVSVEVGSTHVEECIDIRYQVRDTGRGISPADQERLFEPFTRVTPDSHFTKTGTGLGLTIVSHLTGLLKGAVTVESAVGAGSTFQVALPHRNVEFPTWPERPALAGRHVLTLMPMSPRLTMVREIVESLSCKLTVLAPTVDLLPRIQQTIDDAALSDTPIDVVHWPLCLAPALPESLEATCLQMCSNVEVRHLIEYLSLSTAGAHPTITPLCGAPFVADQFVQALDGLHTVRDTSECESATSTNVPMMEPVPASVMHGLADHDQQHTILLVEDNLTNLELLEYQLRCLGYQSIRAINGLEAIELLGAHRVDLVITDLQMPEMDGYQLVDHIRKSEGRTTSSLPVIALTAHALPTEREKCLHHGFNDCLTKPIRRARLSMLLDRWLDEPLHGNHEDAHGVWPSDVNIDLDVTYLLNEFEYDYSRVMSLIERYQRTTATLITQLRDAAMRPDDSDQLGATLHTLVGSSRTIGAMRLAGLCQELSGAIQVKNREQILTHIERIQQAFERFEHVIPEFKSAQ